MKKMAEKISMDKLPKWMKNMQGISEIPFYRNKGQSNVEIYQVNM